MKAMTLTSLVDQLTEARKETKKLFKVHKETKTIKTFEAWRISFARRNELNALIQSW